jgi:hypothetical protein
MVSASPCAKLRFSTKRAAKRYLKAHRWNNGLRARHVYLCRGCDSWHLTSQRWRP